MAHNMCQKVRLCIVHLLPGNDEASSNVTGGQGSGTWSVHQQRWLARLETQQMLEGNGVRKGGMGELPGPQFKR